MLTKSTSFKSPLIIVRFSWLGLAKFSSLPEDKLSITIILLLSTNSSTIWEPIKPKPPVTTIVLSSVNIL